jgi:hypothetical protein
MPSSWVSRSTGDNRSGIVLLKGLSMGLRLAFASATLVTILLSAPTRASACDDKGGGGLPWLGATAGFTSRPDGSNIRPGWLIGEELGISIPINLYERGRCPFVGIGAKLFYSGIWIGAVPLRISYPLPTVDDVPTLYLQVGPAFRAGIPGLDVEAGVDWVVAAAFVGTTWFPDGDDRGATVVVGARLSLLAVAWWLSVQASGGFTY